MSIVRILIVAYMKHKFVKITMLVLAILVAGILLTVLAVVSLAKLSEYLAQEVYQYREYDPEKMVAYLEKRYNIDFPDNIKEVKAAKTWPDRDSSRYFILKFIAEPNDVSKFLESVPGGAYKLYPYNPREDTRLYDVSRDTQWYAEPIKEGKKGYINVEVPGIQNVGFTIYVYIDTTDDKNHVVYLAGDYESEFD